MSRAGVAATVAGVIAWAGGWPPGAGRQAAPAVALAQTSVRVTLRDGRITPGFMSARLNERVDLTVVNAGQRVHNLVIPDFYIFTPNLNPGEQVSVSFTPDKTGSFPYYSDTGGRPERGMQGTLRVAGGAAHTWRALPLVGQSATMGAKGWQ